LDPQPFELDVLLVAFLIYCVEDCASKIQPKTADEYVSHVLKTMEDHDFEPDRARARSKRYKRVYTSLLTAWRRKVPARLREKIPFTIPFIIWAFGYIDRSFPDLARRRLFKAILATGHACSLRPGEFLRTAIGVAPQRYLNASLTFVWLQGKEYAATEVSSWPPGEPSHIAAILDVRKNSPDSGGPVAMSANRSRDPDRFCCVRILAAYIRNANLQAGQPLFVLSGQHVGTTEISAILKATAQAFGLDPDRVCPSCLRKNVITQMSLDTPQLMRRLQGGWRSDAGEKHYWAQLFQVADANEHAVHNAGGATAEVIRAIFSTPAAA